MSGGEVASRDGGWSHQKGADCRRTARLIEFSRNQVAGGQIYSTSEGTTNASRADLSGTGPERLRFKINCPRNGMFPASVFRQESSQESVPVCPSLASASELFASFSHQTVAAGIRREIARMNTLTGSCAHCSRDRTLLLCLTLSRTGLRDRL